MYDRLLDKGNQPTDEFIESYLGEQSINLLAEFENQLNSDYQITRELRFPFGGSYGWGYKYSHKSSHLCYAFFEAGAFTVTLQLGDSCVTKVQQIIQNLLPKTSDLWRNRYPCGKQGGWIHYRVLDKIEINDVIELIKIKKKPTS
jgi:hypothetical protein